MLSLKHKTKEQLAISSDVRVLRAIDKIFNFAIGVEADEIHFEPRANDLAVNFLAQGELLDVLVLPKKLEAAAISAIKEMAGLNYPADNAPRIGRFKQDHLGYKIVFSLNIHATATGDKVIVSLRKSRFELRGLGRLGFSGKSLAQVKKVLAGRKGLVAVIGNHDSGTTATLYSFLNSLKHPELNIATVEREVAFDLPEINQCRLDPAAGLDSRAALKAIRRQDADIVMISETDDRETAEAAFQLAQAGHFVLLGVASRDLAAALQLWQDLGVPPAIFSAKAKLAITERLVKKNCPHCLTPRKIDQSSLRRLEKYLPLKKLLARLKEDKIISKKVSRPEDLVFYKSRGCARCRQRGSAGWIGLFEVLAITPEVKSLIKSGHLSALGSELEKQGSYSLAEDALIKALGGLISLDEVFRTSGKI